MEQENNKKEETNLSPDEFCELYGEEFEEFLKTPLVAKCLSRKQLIPYEYTNIGSLRFRRSKEDISEIFVKSKKLALYFLRSNTPIFVLEKICGGNPVSYVNSMYKYSD